MTSDIYLPVCVLSKTTSGIASLTITLERHAQDATIATSEGHASPIDHPWHPSTHDDLPRLRKRTVRDDLIVGTVVAVGARVDVVITAQQARAYGPITAGFDADDVIGATPEETLHVGMGQVTDLKACHELGVRVVSINRSDESLNPARPPAQVLPDLSKLTGLLA